MLVLDQTSIRWLTGSKRQRAPAVSSGWALARCQRSVRRITRYAAAKSPATSPNDSVFSKARLLPSGSCTMAAPGFIASNGSVTTGKGSYSTSMRAAASSAV